LYQLKRQRAIEAENKRLKGHSTTTDELLGDSQAMMNLRANIRRAAAQPFTVLIQGESGSGKELVASALHKECTQRAKGPLVVVNCGAIPASVVEAELFGYRRGAFTGALDDHPGFFQQADEGTLFLDEIGELPMELQSKLLRAIETKSIRPMGATGEIKVDVRIVAATNRNLDQEVKLNRFRSDLYFRLNRIPIRVPALREHAEDIPMLVHAFLDRLSEECHRTLTISEEALKELKSYSWPGNVRQLKGLLESLVVMSESERIEADAVKRCLMKDEPKLEGPPSLNLDELERWAAEKALKQTSANVTQAAQVLGISRDTLHSKMKKWGLTREVGMA
jgi:DNA-binding NtrC family response regulator